MQALQFKLKENLLTAGLRHGLQRQVSLLKCTFSSLLSYILTSANLQYHGNALGRRQFLSCLEPKPCKQKWFRFITKKKQHQGAVFNLDPLKLVPAAPGPVSSRHPVSGSLSFSQWWYLTEQVLCFLGKHLLHCGITSHILHNSPVSEHIISEMEKIRGVEFSAHNTSRQFYVVQVR